MVKGLILTDRDKRLLYDCYNSGTLTFRQVQRRHFPNNSPSTIYNRVQGLKRAGYLTSTRVGILLHQNGPQEIGVVYRPTVKCLTTLSRLYPQEAFRERPIRLNTASLPHDLILVELIDAFKRRFPGCRIVRPVLYCGDPINAKRIPDAVVLDHVGRPNIAIELELTVKSKSRYRQIILNYRLSTAFKKIIYVAGSDTIKERIRSQITQLKRLPGQAPPSTERFYFVTLSDFLRAPLAVRITNGAEDLSNEL